MAMGRGGFGKWNRKVGKGRVEECECDGEGLGEGEGGKGRLWEIGKGN